MVIFFNMLVKKNIAKLPIIIIAVLIPLFCSSAVSAASPSLSFYPSSGIIKNQDDGFTVDVLVDSAGEELNQARITFTFNPRQIQIKKASRNNSLFSQWPEDESTLDNTNGVVMLTGFTQSGSGDLYITSGEPDVLARLEFEIVADDDADISLEWEFTGSDSLFKTSLMADGSPPYNVLTIRPQDATFRYGELTRTAIESKHIPFIVGGFLILAAGIVITSRPDSTRKKYGTVVVYGN